MILWHNFFRHLNLLNFIETLKRAGSKLRQKRKCPTGFRLRIAKEAASDIFQRIDSFLMNFELTKVVDVS